ncbi:MAG: amidohydrolase family protein, partial [Mycobacteriales bacterium]
MTDLEIIDMHTHVQRDEAHGHEIRDYFLGPNLVKPGAPNLGTLPELLEMNEQVGIAGSNMLMFTWTGRYLRHGTYTLPHGEPARSEAEIELRQRVAQRASDNNSWAAKTCAEHPQLTFFAGVNPVVMRAEGVVEEVEAQRARGAVGVKIVPSDMGIPGSDERLFPLYEHCSAQGIPVLTETGAHSPHSHPAGFAGALKAFPQLTLVFAHCGHDRELGRGLDQEVLELAAKYD